VPLHYGLIKHLLFNGSERLTGKLDLTLGRAVQVDPIKPALQAPGMNA
jgi:hypothetical protein